MANVIISICMMLLAAGYLYATSQLPLLTNVDPVGPKAFPVLIGIGLIVSASLLLFETIRAKGKLQEKEKLPDEARPPLLLVGGVASWTLIYFLLFQPLGFLVSTTIYLFAFMSYFNRNRWYTNALVAVLFTVVMYALFVKVLDIALADGVLSF